MHFTFRSKIIGSGKNITKEIEYLDEYAKIFSRIERKMYIDLVFNGKSKGGIKKEYCAKHQITARQFNSIYSQIDGKIKAVKELKNLESKTKKEKIKKHTTLIEKLEKQKEKQNKELLKLKQSDDNFKKVLRKYRNLKFKLHQKKRKLNILTQKLQKVDDDLKNKISRICFGSKDFFKKQYNLEKNGFGSYIEFENIVFKYGQQHIDKCKETYVWQTKGGKIQKYWKGAMTHRFCKNEHGWYIYTAVDVGDKDVITDIERGAIGVDFNVNFFSLCLVDRFENPIKEMRMDYEMYNKSTNQVDSMLRESIYKIVKRAKELKVDVCIENLKLENKKVFLGNKNKKHSRMLSSFPYRKYIGFMESACTKEGVGLRKVNPAYTSVIGQAKYIKRYGLSSHGSAALVIARRGIGFKEKCTKIDFIRKNSKFKIAKNNKKFGLWKEVAKCLKDYSFSNRIKLLQTGLI